MTGDDRVEAALRELGGRLAVPEPPTDPAAAVLARLAEPATRPAPRVLPRLVAAAVALLVALAVAMAVSPTVRATVLDLLRIGGVEIHYTPPPVTPTTSDPPRRGSGTSRSTPARAAVPFDIRVPRLLGDPDSVRVIDGADGGPPRVVSLRYPGARVDEFGGRIAPFFEKFTPCRGRRAHRRRRRPGHMDPAPAPGALRRRARHHPRGGRPPRRKTLIWEENG